MSLVDRFGKTLAQRISFLMKFMFISSSSCETDSFFSDRHKENTQRNTKRAQINSIWQALYLTGSRQSPHAHAYTHSFRPNLITILHVRPILTVMTAGYWSGQNNTAVNSDTQHHLNVDQLYDSHEMVTLNKRHESGMKKYLPPYNSSFFPFFPPTLFLVVFQ